MKLNEMHQLNRISRITKEILQPLTHEQNVSRDLFPEAAGPSLIPAPQDFLKDSELSQRIWDTTLLHVELFGASGWSCPFPNPPQHQSSQQEGIYLGVRPGLQMLKRRGPRRWEMHPCEARDAEGCTGASPSGTLNLSSAQPPLK